MKHNRELLPLKKALAWIFSSSLVTLIGLGGALFYWQSIKHQRLMDPHYNIVAIVQSCASPEPLQTDFLAQLLELSVDQPVNLHRFNAKKGVEKLLACPLIKSAQIKKIKPSMLFVEYALRRPIAYLSEYSHAAIDEEGIVIPVKPFFRPKKIYELKLGLPTNLEWGTKVSGKKLHLVHCLLGKLASIGAIAIKKIDVSRAFSKKYGERELVIFLENRVVRLSPQNWDKQLENYSLLHTELSRLETANYTIDLRLSQLGFIEKGEKLCRTVNFVKSIGLAAL